MTKMAPAPFIADTKGIDFLNSVTSAPDGPNDRLLDGEGLIGWLRQSGLVPAEQLELLAGVTDPGDLDRVAHLARELREWFRGFVKRHMGCALDAGVMGEIQPINELLERDEAFGRIVFDDSTHIALQTAKRWRSAESLLIPIGEAMARTIVEEDFTHVKACQGNDCTLMFADHTRGRRRRWCSMGMCGNRAKVTAHRSRKRRRT